MPLEIGGNSVYYNEWSGRSRTPYTQHVQHKNVLIQMTMTPVNVRELTKQVHEMLKNWNVLWLRDHALRFPGESRNSSPVSYVPMERLNFENASFINIPETAYTLKDGLLIADLGTVFLAVRFFNNDPQIFSVNNERFRDRIIIADKAPVGELCGYVAEVIEKSQYVSEEKLRKNLNARTFEKQGNRVAYKSLNGFRLEAAYNNSGTFTVPLFDWGYGATERQSIITAPPFRQPEWPTGEGFGKIPEWSVNNKKFDINACLPLFNGKELILKNREMSIKVGKMEFRRRYP